MLYKAIVTTEPFNINVADKVFSACASDLPLRNLDLSDGLTLINHIRGTRAEFILVAVKKDEGDIMWWTLLPTVHTVALHPNLEGWSVVIFND